MIRVNGLAVLGTIVGIGLGLGLGVGGNRGGDYLFLGRNLLRVEVTA